MIYVDNAATTKVKPEVVEAMRPYFEEQFFNPSSNYTPSYEVMDEVDRVRELIARSINSDPEEIYFTSGGSEANNMCIKGAVFAIRNEVPWVITDNIEHHSVLNACNDLQKLGFARIRYLPVTKDGICYGFDSIFLNKIDLISTMYCNNEIGSTQPIHEIGKVCKKFGALFHVDAVQAFGKYKIDVKKENIDMLSVSGHKFGAPKGIGFCYIRNGIKIMPLISGGQQELGLRAGTENVPYIIGLGKAVEIAMRDMDKTTNHDKNLKFKMFSLLVSKFGDIKINGHPIVSAPNILNVNFSEYGVRGEELLAFLDENGIYASSGSACNSHSGEPSHVLKAIGLSDDEADCSVRFSFNENNTEEEVEQIVDVVTQGVNLLRR